MLVPPTIKIPVCYSFETTYLDEFSKDIYVPIGCGGYTSDKMKFLDNSGEDNISKYNVYLNEMTMIYWLGKNYDKLGNPDFIGTAQYRRYLQFDINELKENTILCTATKNPVSIYSTYCYFHNKNDINTFIFRLVKYIPSIRVPLQDYLNQNLTFRCNLFVFSKKLFFEYYNFIEACIKVAIEILPELKLDERTVYQKRALGFILERMTGFWIFLKLATYKAIKAKSIKMIEENINSPYKRVRK